MRRQLGAPPVRTPAAAWLPSLPLLSRPPVAVVPNQHLQAGKGSALSWALSLSQFAHPATSSVNIVGQAMGPFVFAANMFAFVMLLAVLVTERERGLRQALRTAGMLESAYWLSWLAVELGAALLFSLLLIAFGAMFQFAFFLKNSFGLVRLVPAACRGGWRVHSDALLWCSPLAIDS